MSAIIICEIDYVTTLSLLWPVLLNNEQIVASPQVLFCEFKRGKTLFKRYRSIHEN